MQLLQHPFLRVQHDLQARGVCQTISLDFLTKEDLQNYLELEFAHPNFPPEFLSLLHARTEGNALFMVDVLRYLKEQKVIAQVNQRWVLSETVPDIDRQLPESVRGMIQRNIDMLGEDGRRLLVAASVEGYEFHASIIAQVLNLDPADVEEQLDELDRRHGFIRVVTEEELPDGMVTVRCRFVHVLYQSALYASLKPARRASLSGAVARALENSYKHRAKEIASGLAILFEAAREFDRCAEYFYQAALNARNVFAFQEAVILARRGLAALRPLEKTPSLLRTEVLLHLTLGIALLPIKGFGNDEVRDNFDAAYQSRHAIEPGRELVAALAGLFEYHIARLEIPTARQLAEQLIDLGLQGGFPAFAVRGREALGVSMFFAGNFEEAIETLEQALHQYEAGEYRTRFRYYDIDLSVVCLTIIGRALTLLGYLEQGKAKVTKAVEVALSLPDPYSQCWAYQMCAGTLAQTQADPAGLEQAVEALISIANENGLAYWKAHGIGHKGWLLCLKGNLDEGIALLRRGREGVAMSGTRPSILYLTGLLAEALARHGRTDEALEILESEMADADRLGMTFAELARIRAYLLAALSRPTDSEIWFESAISTARSQNARLYQLKTLTTWLRCSSNDSQRQRIRSEIAVLLESMTEGRDWPVLIEARQALGSGSES
jgi:tetratricopeptide (TPR) repeat protein